MTKEEIAERGTRILEELHAEGIGLVNALEILGSALVHVAAKHGVSREEVFENLDHGFDLQESQGRKDVQ